MQNNYSINKTVLCRTDALVSKISIVTVCYNEFGRIAKTIKSVIAQEVEQEIEYIIVDGGSTDGTLDVVHTFDGKISYILSEKDNGIYDAMNKGIRIATGDIIGFLNSGDCYTENALAQVISVFEKKDVDVVYGDVIRTHNGETGKIRKGDPDPSNSLFYMIACHQGVFVRCDIQKKHEFDLSYKVAADRKLLIDLFLEGRSFYYIEKVLAYYDDTGISSRKNYEYQIEELRLTYNSVSSSNELRNRYIEQVEEKIWISEFKHDLTLDERRKEIKAFICEIISINKRIIIWGTGEYGRFSCEMLRSLGYQLRGFIDSYSNKKEYLGEKVFQPDNTLIDDNTVIIVGTIMYSEEIIKKIITMDSFSRLRYYTILDLIIKCEINMGKSINSILNGQRMF